MTADAVVIGAGCAGLSAAVRMAAAGLDVVVAEQAPRLGGRATAFTDRETGERVDNGQHVLFGCYRETYNFLRQIGTEARAPLQRRMRIAMASLRGELSVLAPPARRPPWHLVEGVLRWPALPIQDRWSAARLAPLLMAARRQGPASVSAAVPADLTVSAWLAERGQSRRLIEWLWRPLALAALNQSPDLAAAAPFVRVLAELFGPRVEDSAIGLPDVPLDQLYAEPARRWIEARGGVVLTRAPARVTVHDAGGFDVDAGETRIETPAVVSAVPWHAFAQLWGAGVPPPLAPIAEHAARTASSPIVTVNLWFDGAVMTERFVGLVDGPMHWVFDKSAIFGGDAGHLSVVASGADELAALENSEITDRAVKHLAGALPLSRTRQLRRSVVIREHRATFSLAPGAPPRPPTATSLPGFFLAGDWTDTGLPATIEGAVLSGHRAADAVLRSRADSR